MKLYYFNIMKLIRGVNAILTYADAKPYSIHLISLYIYHIYIINADYV